MSNGKNGKDDDYDVGYGKPPKHSQFVPGQSGFQGHRKKRPESQAEIVARVRDQVVEVNGRMMPMLELSMMSVMNQTIKSGKPKDLKVLFELLDKYGAIPDVDRYAEAEAGADEAMRKIFQVFDRHLEIDPVDREAIQQAEGEEVELVIGCPHCGPELRRRWRDPDYVVTSRRYDPTGLHSVVKRVRERRRQKKRGC